MKGGIGVLPNYSYLILDEAHHIEAVATKQFGIELSNSRVERFLNSLYNANRNKGLFIRKNSPTELVDDTWRACDNQFAAIRQFTGGSPTRLVESTYFVENLLSEPLSKIGSHLKALSDTAVSEDDKQEISAHKNRCDDIRTDFELMLDHSRRDHVYWIEGNHSRNVLRANPLKRRRYTQRNPVRKKEMRHHDKRHAINQREFRPLSEPVGAYARPVPTCWLTIQISTAGQILLSS